MQRKTSKLFPEIVAALSSPHKLGSMATGKNQTCACRLAEGPFDFVCLTRSPPYTPLTADPLFDRIREAFAPLQGQPALPRREAVVDFCGDLGYESAVRAMAFPSLPAVCAGRGLADTSESSCQGRGRTADLPLFRRIAWSTRVHHSPREQVELHLGPRSIRGRPHVSKAVVSTALAAGVRVFACGGREPRHSYRVGCQNSVTGLDLAFYALRSYSLIRPPRTGRRLIRSRERSATGWSGRGGRSWRPRWGRRPL